MKTWLISVLLISFALLAIIKAHQVTSLAPYFRAEKTHRLNSFKVAKQKVTASDLDLLELWESILTGRSAPLSRIMKNNYKVLGLNHIFTPSGFHLSAVLFPFMKIIKSSRMQLTILILVGGLLYLLPGFGALKRMVLIKVNQKGMGLHAGFATALLLDMFFGTFQNSPLSFTYSFLFIGIIYSGLKGLGLIIWFFIAQMMIAFFQSNDISLLLLLFSPLLNFCFAMIMPLLFLFAFPLWDWQLHSGIFILRMIQKLVDSCARVSLIVPTIEVNVMVFVIILFFIFKRKKFLYSSIAIFSFSLNLDLERASSTGKYEFHPRGKVVRTVYREKDVSVYFSDGKCRMKLVRGFWLENCSPIRRSSKKKTIS